MKNVVHCRLCICAGRAICSDLTSVPKWTVCRDLICLDGKIDCLREGLETHYSNRIMHCQRKRMSTRHTITSELLPCHESLSGYVLLPQVSETCLNKGLPRKVFEHTRFLSFKVCPKCFHFPPCRPSTQSMNYLW